MPGHGPRGRLPAMQPLALRGRQCHLSAVQGIGAGPRPAVEGGRALVIAVLVADVDAPDLRPAARRALDAELDGERLTALHRRGRVPDRDPCAVRLDGEGKRRGGRLAAPTGLGRRQAQRPPRVLAGYRRCGHRQLARRVGVAAPSAKPDVAHPCAVVVLDQHTRRGRLARRRARHGDLQRQLCSRIDPVGRHLDAARRRGGVIGGHRRCVPPGGARPHPADGRKAQAGGSSAACVPAM